MNTEKAQHILEDLNWRYATKQYDSSKKVSETDLNTLLEVIRLSPSSYGLQPFKVLVIENPEIREKLKEKSFNQTPITDASHLLVFCSYLKMDEFHVDRHIENIANSRGVELNQVSGYGDFMKAKIHSLDVQTQKVWNSKQAYIAIGMLLHAAASLRIDSTPMEGFDADGYDEILGLKAKNLHASIICPIGYRSENDPTQHLRKVRKATSDFIEIVK